MATLKSPVDARDFGPLWSFTRFIFFLSFTLYLAPALPALLFFLIFYSLFGPCLARPFIFPYLLFFIWPLPFPHGPAPCPTLPCLAARFSESHFPHPVFRRSIKTRNRRRTHRHCCNYIQKNSTVRLGQSPFNVNRWMKGWTDGRWDGRMDGKDHFISTSFIIYYSL
jgi:hypothetical protein